VWINDGLRRFDVAQVVGARDTTASGSRARPHLGNRGVLDVIVANQRGPLLIYKNNVEPNPALDSIRLGPVSNHNAFGAASAALEGSVGAGSARRPASRENQRRVHYGPARRPRSCVIIPLAVGQAADDRAP
jgi:hypothetical protein